MDSTNRQKVNLPPDPAGEVPGGSSSRPGGVGTSSPAAIAERLHGKKSGAGWQARCPAHADKNASLSISEGADGRTLLHCHAGCTFDAVVAASGIPLREFFKVEKELPRDKPRIVVVYNYTDPAGKLLFQVCRYIPKDFRQRRPDPAAPGAWRWDMRGVERVLYRLPDVVAAVAAGRTVHVVEGEKDADTLGSLGLCATCNAGGACKWSDAYTAALAGARVVILPDRDTRGREHAAMVLSALVDKTESVRVVELPDRDGHAVKDAADWVGAGGTAEELAEIIRDAPAWTPPIDQERKAPAPAATGDVKSIRAALWEIAGQKKKSATEINRESAAAVVAWLHMRGRFYFHRDRRDFAGVMFFDGARKLLLPVQGDAFTAWLSDALAVNRSETTFRYISLAVETEGLSERSTGIEPGAFWAATPAAFYLSNGPGRMVRITAGRVDLMDNGADEILFPYGATLPEWMLTDPVDPFEACSLFRGASAQAVHGKELLKLFAISLPTDQRTKPPLSLSGAIGSGKTRLARGIFELYGLPQRIAAVHKNGEGDFWAALDGGGLACFDNADTRVDWLPDALAAAATAGTQEKRKLYTDAERVSLRARAWVCITSASPSFAADAGLADRLIVVRLGRREGQTSEAALSDEIAAARDAGLSWIAHTLSRALADKGDVPSGLNARHPDFARLAVRIGRAMGRGEQAIAALRAAEADKGLFNLENDTVGAAMLELLQAGPFNGTASELLTELVGIEPSFDGTLSAKRLSKRIAKLWPHLESVFNARQDRDGHTKALLYRFNPASNAEYAVNQTAFSEKSLVKEIAGTLPKLSIETPHTPQNTPPDLPFEQETAGRAYEGEF